MLKNIPITGFRNDCAAADSPILVVVGGERGWWRKSNEALASRKFRERGWTIGREVPHGSYGLAPAMMRDTWIMVGNEGLEVNMALRPRTGRLGRFLILRYSTNDLLD